MIVGNDGRFNIVLSISTTMRRLRWEISLTQLHVSGKWTNERELTIRLGYGAYVTAETLPTSSTSACSGPTSCITLLDGGVRTEAFAVLSSVGSTAVMLPEIVPAVTAVLVAPQVGLFSS